MYIISKHKDYYDGVAGSMGIDKTIVYERHQTTVDNHLEIPNEFKETGGHRRNYDNPIYNIGYSDLDLKKSKKYSFVSTFLIGFCGKLYIGWRFFYKVRKDHMPFDETVADIVYDYDVAKEYLKETYWKHNLVDDVKYVETYDAINIFRKFNTPVFAFEFNENKIEYYNGTFISNGGLSINPVLKNFEFYKIFDAFLAFQEIQMFLSGVLGSGENDIVEVEDKYKIAQHGYDDWSFRKEPEKKKERGSFLGGVVLDEATKEK